MVAGRRTVENGENLDQIEVAYTVYELVNAWACELASYEYMRAFYELYFGSAVSSCSTPHLVSEQQSSS